MVACVPHGIDDGCVWCGGHATRCVAKCGGVCGFAAREQPPPAPRLPVSFVCGNAGLSAVAADVNVPSAPVPVADMPTAILGSSLFLFPDAPKGSSPFYYVLDMLSPGQGWQRVPPTPQGPSSAENALPQPEGGLEGLGDFVDAWAAQRAATQANAGDADVREAFARAERMFDEASSGTSPTYGLTYLAAACTVDDSSVYIAGGGLAIQPKDHPLAYVWRVQSGVAALQPMTPLPTAVAYAAMAFFPTQNALYVSGGKNSREVANTVHRLRLGATSGGSGWEAVASMQHSRAGHGMLQVKGLLWAFGGWPPMNAPAYQITTEYLSLSPMAPSWLASADMTIGTGFMASATYNCMVCMCFCVCGCACVRACVCARRSGTGCSSRSSSRTLLAVVRHGRRRRAVVSCAPHHHGTGARPERDGHVVKVQSLAQPRGISRWGWSIRRHAVPRGW